jgi:threonine/homoserine/homoserine lactone efflux protein
MGWTPGPNNIMSMNNGANFGFKNSLPFNFGVFFGCFSIVLVCIFSSALLFDFLPQIELPMKILGAGYMLFLSYKTIKPAKKKNNKNISNSFSLAIILQFINAKFYVIAITAAAFVIPYYSQWYMLLLFAFIIAFMCFSGTVAWAAFGALFNKLFINHRLLMNWIIVILLLYCCVSLFYKVF